MTTQKRPEYVCRTDRWYLTQVNVNMEQEVVKVPVEEVCFGVKKG